MGPRRTCNGIRRWECRVVIQRQLQTRTGSRAQWRGSGPQVHRGCAAHHNSARGAPAATATGKSLAAAAAHRHRRRWSRPWYSSLRCGRCSPCRCTRRSVHRIYAGRRGAASGSVQVKSQHRCQGERHRGRRHHRRHDRPRQNPRHHQNQRQGQTHRQRRTHRRRCHRRHGRPRRPQRRRQRQRQRRQRRRLNISRRRASTRAP
jgi:hypothetical protein